MTQDIEHSRIYKTARTIANRMESCEVYRPEAIVNLLDEEDKDLHLVNECIDLLSVGGAVVRTPINIGSVTLDGYMMVGSFR